MCGIAGILSLSGRPPAREELRAMTDVLFHRGPDSGGLYVDGRAGLAMRRLSIIDIAGGSQPVCNEDGSVWTVFNGEIYNFADLREELLQQGHAFRTRTDTETIVHLYEEHGPFLVERMRGMFAFALWDARSRLLLLARDRLGIKPLYWAEIDGRLLFASELKAILQLPEVPRRLDWSAVNKLFTSLCTPPAQSIVEGIRKLEPGCLLIASPDRGIRSHRYWTFHPSPDRSRGEDELAGQLRELLEESVRLHMVSDVPLGAFLSGGIDSSSIVAAMAKHSSRPVKTFSIGFAEKRFDESGYARLVAHRFATEHHELILRPDALDIIEDLAWHLDEPFGDSSAIPTFMVSKLAAGHVRVVLSGDGGDELFAGYDKYLVEGRERRLGLLPRAARRTLGAAARALPDGIRGRNLLRHISLDGAERYLDASTLFHAEEKEKLFSRDVFGMIRDEDPWRWEKERLRENSGHWLSALQTLDMLGYLPIDILTKVDRMSMAHSLEARVPMLDHRLVEFAATIPPEISLRGRETKRLLKRAMRLILPDPVIDRPKQGFAVPLGDWFRGGLEPFARDLLLCGTARGRGIIEPSYVERLLARHAGNRPLDLHLWTLISFELWCRTFLDRGGAPASVEGRAPLEVEIACRPESAA